MTYSLLKIAGVATAANRATMAAKSALRRTAVYAVAGVIGLVGSAFLLSALWIYLAQWLGPVQAGLWVGGGLMGAAVLVLLVGMSIGRSSTDTLHMGSPEPDPVEVASRMLTEFQQQFKGKKGSGLQAAATAVAAGFLLSRLLRK